MSTTKSLFLLPDDGETLARLIESIPSDWAWIDGHLCAPEFMANSSQIAHTIELNVSRWHSIRPTLVGAWKNQAERTRYRPDLASVLIHRKLPASVHFDEAGFQASTPSFADAQMIAAHFLRLGYRGWFSISAGCDDNNKHENPAYVQMRPNKGIEIGMNSHYRGRPEMVEPILAVCRALGLKALESPEQNPPP